MKRKKKCIAASRCLNTGLEQLVSNGKAKTRRRCDIWIQRTEKGYLRGQYCVRVNRGEFSWGAQARDTSVSSQAWSPLTLPRKHQLGAELFRLAELFLAGAPPALGLAHSPERAPLGPSSFTSQGSFPCSSNEITSGLETETPAPKK